MEAVLKYHPGVGHRQITSCYCCQCREPKFISEVFVPDGADFSKVNPRHEGWELFTKGGHVFYICPEHDLVMNMIIDGKVYEETPPDKLGGN